MNRLILIILIFMVFTIVLLNLGRYGGSSSNNPEKYSNNPYRGEVVLCIYGFECQAYCIFVLF